MCALCADTDLLAVHHFDVCTDALLTFGAVKSYLIGIDSTLDLEDTSLFALLAGLHMLVNEVSALDDNLSFLRGYLEDLTYSSLKVTLRTTGDDDYCIALLNVKCIHFSTSLKNFGSE